MMGIGKPVIFTASEAFARIPANACLRLDVGPDEERMLAGYINWLAGNREAGSKSAGAPPRTSRSVTIPKR